VEQNSSRTLRAVESSRRTLNFSVEPHSGENHTPSAAKPGRAPPLAQCREDPPPFNVVPKDQAHPVLPTLLYRFYDEKAVHVLNLPLVCGFIAGAYMNVRGAWDDPEPHFSSRLFPHIHVSGTYLLSTFTSANEA